MILIEPDQHKLGWGVAKYSGFLQDLEVAGDKEDSRRLYITVHKPSSTSSKGTPVPLLSATFTFDDHIRCMAAKQRLTKARTKARNRKMNMIAKMLELPGNVGPPPPGSPQATLATLRQESRRNRLGSNVNLPPSQRTTPSPRNSGGASGSGYRPMFDSTLRVPGSAAKLVPREKQKLRRPTPRHEKMEGIPMGPISSSLRDKSPDPSPGLLHPRGRREGSPGFGVGGMRHQDEGDESSSSAGGSIEMGREAETSFETTPIWYVDNDEASSKGSRSVLSIFFSLN